MAAGDIGLLGIDWGSSRRRAYLLDRAGLCAARHEDGQGALAVQGRFAAALDDLLAQLPLPAGVPIVMSGMVGSAQGWQEAPYLACALPLDELPNHLLPVAGGPSGHPAYIVPGYRCDGPDIDVMRGEETQLLGAVALGQRDGWFVLPGTHSKWALLRDGCVARLSTFMTGELFALLAQGGTLAALMAGSDDEDALAAGAMQARRRAPLSHALFAVRARVVTGALPAEQARSFVSGLLIGTEFVAATEGDDGGPGGIALIGSAALCAPYAQVARLYGMGASVLDAQRVYCAALARLMQKVAA